jgi:hypothetical protein
VDSEAYRKYGAKPRILRNIPSLSPVSNLRLTEYEYGVWSATTQQLPRGLTRGAGGDPVVRERIGVGEAELGKFHSKLQRPDLFSVTVLHPAEP